MTPVEIWAKYADLIKPALAGWTRLALNCFHHRKEALQHGPLIAVRISKGSMWWTVDDLLREPLGQVKAPRDSSVYFVWWGNWYIIQLVNLPKVVDHLTQAGVINRLRVREVIDPAGCSHKRCAKLDNVSGLTYARMNI